MGIEQKKVKTLRLLMPQQQGGYNATAFPGQIYPLSAGLLAWLAPHSDTPLIEVPIAPYTRAKPAKEEGAFYGKSVLHMTFSIRSQ